MKLHANVHGDRAYADKLRDFFRETGKELAPGLRQEARLMSVSLAHETQPFGRDKEAQGKGQSAVARDIKRLFATPEETFAVVLAQDGQAVADEFYVLTSQGHAADAEKLLGTKSTSKLSRVPVVSQVDPAVHAANRTNKGRVRARVAQIVLDAKSRERFIRAKQRMVGFAKSGWATCARALGGTRGIPGWVSRNKGPGTVLDRSAARLNPGVTLKNEVSYIDKVLRPEGVDRAFQAGRNRLSKMIDIALRKALAKARLK